MTSLVSAPYQDVTFKWSACQGSVNGFSRILPSAYVCCTDNQSLMQWDQEAVRESNYKSYQSPPSLAFFLPARAISTFPAMSSYLYLFRNFALCKSLSSFLDHHLTFASCLALCLTFSLANIGLVAHWTQATLFQDTLVDFEIVGLVAGGLSASVFPVLYVFDPTNHL